MAIPQRKTRLISIDGFEYRWLITFHRNAPFYRIITVAVELSSSPGTKLVVYPIGVDVNFVDYDRDEPITPKIVEEFIRRAIGNGWTPTASSGTFVLGDPSIRFYAGAPLHTRTGQRIGTLCAIDRRPRQLTDSEAGLLAELADIAIDELELRLANRELVERHTELIAARDEARRADAARSQLLTRVSHELRTPIHAITGLCELASGMTTDPSLKRARRRLVSVDFPWRDSPMSRTPRASKGLPDVAFE